jgi:hypothetical protein
MTEKLFQVRRALLGGMLVGALAGRGALARAAKKCSKERVGYRDEPYLGRTCARCVLYPGHGECAIVEGEVRPNGWCLQWTPATVGLSPGPA